VRCTLYSLQLCCTLYSYSVRCECGVLCTHYSYVVLCTVILYAVSAVYFAGVMVRLMLTLTPVVCVLAAIAFSKVMSIYLKDETPPTVKKTGEGVELNDTEKYYDKVSLMCTHNK